MSRERLRRIAILWIVCLVGVSLQPYRPPGESQSVLHRVAHVIAFGGSALMPLALSRSRGEAWMAVLGVVCLALAIETAQHLLYGSRFEWWDLRDDAAGVLIAVVAIRRTRVRSLLLSDSG